jgi:hypothetical protein
MKMNFIKIGAAALLIGAAASCVPSHNTLTKKEVAEG